MSGSLVTDAVLSLMPSWYRCKGGKLPLKIAVEESRTTFFAVRPLTPEMWKLKAHAENHARLFKDFASSFARPIAVDLIQEFLALKWLDLTNETIQWQKVLAYFRELSERTYENTTITKNLILTPNERGTSDITESKHAKIFDILASSPQCFIKTDGQMRFVGYDEIRWKSVRDSEQSKFHPEFLQPFYCALADGEFSIHHTSKRDLIVVGRGGIIATKRKSRWKLYDPNNLKNSLGDILHGEYRIGCNIYEILFDLSFQRHGALLIFDPSDKLNAQVVNPHAWIVPEDADMGSAHSILRRRIRDIKSPVWGTTPKRDKRLFLELASVDGALIFSQSEIKAFGAMTSTGATIDFLLSARRDTAAAKRFLAKALGGANHPHPRVINTDKEAAYPPAIVQLKAKGALVENCQRRCDRRTAKMPDQDLR